MKINTPLNFFGKDTTLKLIQEYFGKPSTQQEDISIAIMTAMPDWKEPAQIAEFDEYVYMMYGELFIQMYGKTFALFAGEALKIPKHTKVKFQTHESSANYIAICLPAFQEHLVKRDEI